MSIILIYLARMSLDRMERMGRAKGTLTMRWQ
jgi:hypothetical protein